MSKFYWLGVIFVVCLGLFTAWYVADQRQNQVLLKPQSFPSVNSVVEGLSPYLEPTHKPRKWVLLGVELQNSIQIEIAKELKKKLSDKSPRVVIVDHFLEGYFSDEINHVFNFQKNYENWVEELEKLTKDQPTLVITPNIYFSYIPFDSLTNLSSGIMDNLDFVVLTMTSFPLTEIEESNFFLPCSESQQLQTSLSDFGCYVRRQSKLRKNEFEKLKAPHGQLLRLNDNEIVLFLRDAK